MRSCEETKGDLDTRSNGTAQRCSLFTRLMSADGNLHNLNFLSWTAGFGTESRPSNTEQIRQTVGVAVVTESLMYYSDMFSKNGKPF